MIAWILRANGHGGTRLGVGLAILCTALACIYAQCLLAVGDVAQAMGLPLRDAREVFEREYLVAQISRFGGNISRTAEFVGMERSALHRKLKALGID